MRKVYSVGVEIEMPVVDLKTGASHRTGSFFETVRRIKAGRLEHTALDVIDGQLIAVCTALVKTGMDNGFNNLESSIGPLTTGERVLTSLHEFILEELRDVQTALQEEDASIINFSEHPDTELTPEFYRKTRAPKPIYDYWTSYRNWNHACGMDAKAHNGPTTGVSFHDAIEALNVILGLSPALIAIYANSPFEGGRLTGFQENRLTIWPRMFSCSKFGCDLKFQQWPDAPFRSLRDYFRWMFGPDTSMQFATCADSTNYKESGSIVLIPGDPSLLEFLRKGACRGAVFNTLEEVKVVPVMRHLEFHQFVPFLDARIRYALADPDLPVHGFFEAFDGADEDLTEFFSRHARYCYIEGRASGANFPDAALAAESDPDVVRSVVISPSALQNGLINNLPEASELLSSYHWPDLAGLRTQAIKYGLAAECNGIRVKDLCSRVVEIAARGLPGEEHWMFAYPEFVLSKGKNGADRAIEAFEKQTGTVAERLRQVILNRRLLMGS
jgi:gamma-glutamylcysteine synthetase